MSKNSMPQEVIAAVQAAGFDVYMRPDSSYLYFTDGKGIGYLEIGLSGLKMTTIHIPNSRTGTGFVVGEFLRPSELTRDNFLTAFCLAPNWAAGEYVSTVRKWRDWEAFASSCAFNASHILVAPAD